MNIFEIFRIDCCCINRYIIDGRRRPRLVNRESINTSSRIKWSEKASKWLFLHDIRYTRSWSNQCSIAYNKPFHFQSNSIATSMYMSAQRFMAQRRPYISLGHFDFGALASTATAIKSYTWDSMLCGWLYVTAATTQCQSHSHSHRMNVRGFHSYIIHSLLL